jgi:Zn finger protein HypA/HybF involved in hydrogenase expression
MDSVFKKKKWTQDDLRHAVDNSKSIRQVISRLGLVEAGGNYTQVKLWIQKLNINTDHFTGRGWNTQGLFLKRNKVLLKDILKENTPFQSHKLKLKLFEAGLKEKKCEICSWNKISQDGRVPLELDHINGDHTDNRIENLRILCPNCHSLQPTHRGRNKKKR